MPPSRGLYSTGGAEIHPYVLAGSGTPLSRANETMSIDGTQEGTADRGSPGGQSSMPKTSPDAVKPGQPEASPTRGASVV
jgi:hypothetical protein